MIFINFIIFFNYFLIKLQILKNNKIIAKNYKNKEKNYF